MLVPPTPPARVTQNRQRWQQGGFSVPVLPSTELVRSLVAKSFLKYSGVQKGERSPGEEPNLGELVFYFLHTT